MNTIYDLAGLTIYPIFGSYISLNESELEQIEQVVECELNGPLKALLERYGCAGFKNSVFANFSEDKFPVTFLFGGGNSSYSVMENIESFGEELPAGMIPFAGDEFGNLFCYKMSGMDSGVYRWNHERDLEEGVNPILLTSNIEMFIKVLQVE